MPPTKRVNPIVISASFWFLLFLGPVGENVAPIFIAAEPQPEERKVKKHASTMLQFFSAVNGEAASLSLRALLKTINKIYEEKVIADEIDDREGKKREPLPEFIRGG